MIRFPLPAIGSLRKRIVAIALVGAVIPMDAALADDSLDLLKAMSDYMASQQSFSFDYQSTIEAVTPDFQKLAFVSSGSATVTRPDKIRVSRTGGFADVEMVYDGATLSVHGKNLNAYAQIEAKGTIDDLINHLADAGVAAPGSDLLSADVFANLTGDMTEAKHIASANVGGMPAEYLAFRSDDIDWQIWIAEGEKPIPLRYVITSKHVSQAPQYTLEVSNFRTGSDVASASFAFDPAGAKKVDISELEMIDELPQQTAEEAPK